MLARVLAYGVFGYATETLFTFGARRPKLPHPAMLPLYGLASPLFPPVREMLRDAPLPVRAAAYGVAIIAVEYALGRALRGVFGAAPWDYSHARFHVSGVTRLDYLPLWALYGLVLERVHDRLTSSEPA